jgi:hypothetical protein
MLRRRRPLPEAFVRCAEHVDLAQRAMIRCVPSSARSAALPLAVGAETLRVALADAVASMDGWRSPGVEREWLACRAALDATLAGVDAAVARAAATDELEVALAAVQDLLDPLHAFVEAETALRQVR